MCLVAVFPCKPVFSNAIKAVHPLWLGELCFCSVIQLSCIYDSYKISYFSTLINHYTNKYLYIAFCECFFFFLQKRRWYSINRFFGNTLFSSSLSLPSNSTIKSGSGKFSSAISPRSLLLQYLYPCFFLLLLEDTLSYTIAATPEGKLVVFA